MFHFVRSHKVLSVLVVLLLVPVAVVAYRAKGPYRWYTADLVLPTPGTAQGSGTLEVGVAQRDITPDLSQYDTWTDADGDGRFDSRKGDTWVDSNQNGRMDLVWMAGFSNNRPAKSVHDPLLTQAIAFRNNGVTLVMVTIDSIGIMHEKFIRVRKSLDPALAINHVMFSCTHNHEAPDTMGIWSYSPVLPKFDHAYLEKVLQSCKEAIEEAVRNLEPADMTLASATIEPNGFVDDSRKPTVYDLALNCARFTKKGSGEPIATMASWGNHVETLGGGNSALTSDFVHYWRRGVEDGVPEPNGEQGLGGMFLFFQGMVGGLMTQLHTDVPHRDGTAVFKEASFEKAEALGENLAVLTVRTVTGPDAFPVPDPRVTIAAKTIHIPMEGMFGWACFLGIIHPGWFWGKGRTEVNAFRIGDLEILAVPGELYPEIAEGGTEMPAGADFACGPVEVPPLRKDLMTGKVNMVIGLANDEIGYIIPKSQWDVNPPYAYSTAEKPLKKPQYGEENSCGPDVAPTIHRECAAVLERLHAAL